MKLEIPVVKPFKHNTAFLFSLLARSGQGRRCSAPVPCWPNGERYNYSLSIYMGWAHLPTVGSPVLLSAASRDEAPCHPNRHQATCSQVSVAPSPVVLTNRAVASEVCLCPWNPNRRRSSMLIWIHIYATVLN